MNLKKAFVSFMAAGAVLAGGFGGAMAQSASDDTTGTVTVTAGGEFNAYFCSGNEQAMDGDLDFGSATVNSSSGDIQLSGNLVVCYKDTKNHRQAFTARLGAGNMTSDAHTIGNENLSLGFVTHVNSGQWSSDVQGVGSIAGRHGNSTSNGVDRPGQEYGNFNFGQGDLLIAQGWAGMGTGSDYYQGVFSPHLGTNYPYDPRSSQGSWHELEVELNVPQTTPSGTYTNTFTLTIAPENP